jgi:hypothetical protein
MKHGVKVYCIGREIAPWTAIGSSRAVGTAMKPAITPDGASTPSNGTPAAKDSETARFLERARQALLAEGFHETPLQYRKKNQVFGVVKQHGDRLQLHVRAFRNGVIESEVELSNLYLQHLWSPRRSAHAEIARIFEKHGVDTATINTEFRTRTGSTRDRLPRMLTPTRQLVQAGMGLAGAVGAVAIARYLQPRNHNTRPWRR